MVEECCYPQNGCTLRKRSRGIGSATGWRVEVEVIILPVVLDCRVLVNAHGNGESQKGLHFFHDLCPLGVLLASHDLLSIPVALLPSTASVKNISKTSLGDSGTAVVGPTGELNCFTSTGFSVLVCVADVEEDGGGGELQCEGCGSGETGGR